MADRSSVGGGTGMRNGASGDWKGNKQALPSKPCAACGRAMSWRRRWARTWDEVRWCSDACRRRGMPPASPAAPAR